MHTAWHAGATAPGASPGDSPRGAHENTPGMFQGLRGPFQVQGFYRGWGAPWVLVDTCVRLAPSTRLSPKSASLHTQPRGLAREAGADWSSTLAPFRSLREEHRAGASLSRVSNTDI